MKLKNAISTLLVLITVSVSAYFAFRCYCDQDADTVVEPQESAVCNSTNQDSTLLLSESRERITANIGTTVTEISFDDYQKLLADSCNLPLTDAPEKIRRNADSLTIFTRDSTITLLNFPYSDGHDFCIEWDYDGYDSARGLHFFSYTGYEAWGYYIADDATGQISEYLANETPVFCAASNLFATMYENPYEGAVFLYIYKLLPGGHIVRVASCNRDSMHHFSFDLRKPVWIAPNSLIAQRAEPEANTPAGFVRIDIDPSAPEHQTPEAAPEWTHEMANDLVRKLKQDNQPT